MTMWHKYAANVADGELEFKIPDETSTIHQIQVESDEVVGDIAIFGKSVYASSYGLLDTLTLGEESTFRLISGHFTHLKFVPSAALGFSVAYTGWVG